MTKERKIISIYEGSVKRTLKVSEKVQEQINEMVELQKERLEELQEYKSVAEEVGLPAKIIDRLKEMELEERKVKVGFIECSNNAKAIGKILEEIKKKESQAFKALIRNMQKRREGDHGNHLQKR